MGTKKNPGKFDCLAKLADDEPFFVLRAQDQNSAVLVRLWAGLAELGGCPAAKVIEARVCADKMDAWPTKKKPD